MGFTFPMSSRIALAIFSSVLSLVVLSSIPRFATAQDPLKELLGGSKTLSRLPDDQIEGTIWEFKCVPQRPSKDAKEGDEPEELVGSFRTEGKAIFAVERRLALPEKKDVEKFVESVRDGKPKDLKLPAPPKPKRIGEYRTLSGGKLRLDLDDDEDLTGLMLIWRKDKTADVWMGTFTQKDGTRTVQTWKVELRPIED